MRLDFKHWNQLAILLCAVLIFSCSNDKKSKKDKKTSYSKDTTTSCECEASWFPHKDTPNTNDSVGGPFDTNSTNNCQFHQWSWNKFLWLTKPGTKGIPLFQEVLYQVGGSMDSLARITDDTVVITDVFQAGSNGILKTNPSYAANGKSHTVMYSIHVDKKMKDASIKFKKMLLDKSLNTTNDSTFPYGALELKVAWVDVAAIADKDTANYYITTAEVDTANGSPKTYTKVAMLGMHVVGRVINHPEFIWASFEHHSLSPDYDWKSTTTTTDAPITSDDDMLLFQNGTVNGVSPIVWDNASKSPYTPLQAFNVFVNGVPRGPNDTYLNTKQDGKTNKENIDSINKCVHSKLSKKDVWRNYFYKGSIWINMDGLNSKQQADRITDFGSSLGNIETDTNLRGSLGLANITMETYTQAFVDTTANFHSLDPNSIANCMSCHSGQPYQIVLNNDTISKPQSPLYVSHLFRSYIDVSETTTLKEARLQRVNEFYMKLKAIKEAAKKE